MGQAHNHSLKGDTGCCSSGCKRDQERPTSSVSPTPVRFLSLERELQFYNVAGPEFIAFGPLYAAGQGLIQKRLAVAGGACVQVYAVDDSDFQAECYGCMSLEHSFDVPIGFSVTALCFSDESSSSHVVAALAPTKSCDTMCFANVWDCERQSRSPCHSSTDGEDKENLPLGGRNCSDAIAVMDGHSGVIRCFATNSGCFATADSTGACQIWERPRNYALVGVETLHEGGIADLALDRLFAYSAGSVDCLLRIWHLPDLEPALTVPMFVPTARVFPHEDAALSGLDAMVQADAEQVQFSRVTVLRRPQSRWAGARAYTPAGTIYIAGVDAHALGGEGPGILSEWRLNPKVTCQAARVAHESPIVEVAFGPYDNGPLVTADRRGVFRVWDIVTKLHCMQEVRPGGNEVPRGLALAVQPQQGIFASLGDNRIFLWRRLQSDDLQEARSRGCGSATEPLPQRQHAVLTSMSI